MSYEEKYLKYKNKYLSLKNSSFNQTGGNFFSMFNKPVASPVADQNTVQNDIINFNNLIARMGDINNRLKDQGLANKIQSINDNWKRLLDVLVDQIKSKEEDQKKYNGLFAELLRKQQNVSAVKTKIDSYGPTIGAKTNEIKSFLLSVSNELKNSEAQLAQFESKILQNSAQGQFNELVHQRRQSLSEEKKGRSRSSSTSSIQSLGTTPK
jgi:hypothetical protein